MASPIIAGRLPGTLSIGILALTFTDVKSFHGTEDKRKKLRIFLREALCCITLEMSTNKMFHIGRRSKK